VLQSQPEAFDRNANKTRSFRQRFFKILYGYRYVVVHAGALFQRMTCLSFSEGVQKLHPAHFISELFIFKLERVDCQKRSAAVGYR
jgi:hypothetical protein